MAMSIVRPDPSLPASVADASFGTGRRGFDQTEVRDFLRMVAAELGRLQERERFLERELRTAQSNPDLTSAPLDEASLTRLLGEETARVLTTARESAAEIRQKAEQSAAQLLIEAGDEASRLREEAEIESSRRRTDAAADAEAELAMAKQQGREMVNEARAYRERVLSELARRRELAREQIEQLLHGRDRLMQSFERARLVAVDVVSELQPLGEPDEYVNLAPTTGPVPVMVPNAPRPLRSVDGPDQTDHVSGADAPVDEPSAEVGPAEVAEDEHQSYDSTTEVAGDADSVDDAQFGQPDLADNVTDDPSDAPESVDVGGTDEVAGAEPDARGSADDGETVGDASGEAAGDLAGQSAPVEDPDAVVEATSDEVVATPDAGDDDSSGTDQPAQPADEPTRDDVVVDLFARLRADTTPTTVDDDTHEAETTALGDGVEDPGGEGVTELPTPDPAVTADDADVTPFARRDAELTPLIVSSAKKLKRVLADEQNEALDALRRKEPIRDIASLLPAPEEHLTRYGSSIADELSAAATSGASSVSGSSRLRPADATAATVAAEAVLDEWLIVPLRERLERCVIDGGGDNVGITRRVRAVYREWKTQHIDEQLDDVFRAAYGRGAFGALEPGTQMVWVADASHTTCADCNDNTLAGPVRVGDAFPTGQQFAPAHPGCRCLVVPTDG